MTLGSSKITIDSHGDSHKKGLTFTTEPRTKAFLRAPKRLLIARTSDNDTGHSRHQGTKVARLGYTNHSQPLSHLKNLSTCPYPVHHAPICTPIQDGCLQTPTDGRLGNGMSCAARRTRGAHPLQNRVDAATALPGRWSARSSFRIERAMHSDAGLATERLGGVTIGFS